jgi:hypothetical protein
LVDEIVRRCNVVKDGAGCLLFIVYNFCVAAVNAKRRDPIKSSLRRMQSENAERFATFDRSLFVAQSRSRFCGGPARIQHMKTGASPIVSLLDFALSQQARHYARPNRVRYPADRKFASSCSPPRLTTTQLLSAIKSEHLLKGDLHPSARACSQAHWERL